MKLKTLEAIKGSIEKWRKIVEEETENRGADDCPLCALFLNRRDLNNNPCAGCPINERTGQIFCRDTPCRDFEDHDDKTNNTCRADTDEKMIAARAEIDFLRSLLPKEASE